MLHSMCTQYVKNLNSQYSKWFHILTPLKKYLPNSERGTSIDAISCQKSRTGSYLHTVLEALPSGNSPPAR